MEGQDPSTSGTIAPAGWPWPSSSSAVPAPVGAMSAEALQAYLLSAPAFFRGQLDGNPEAYPAQFLRTMGAQLLLPTLSGQGQAGLNPPQPSHGTPGAGPPATDAQELQAGDDLQGEDKVLRRQRKLQEKNRRAQKRFRDRQKLKYQESQMVVEELSERCKNLTTTVQNLEHSSHVLEKVVKIKDEVIAKLQTSQDANVKDHELLRADMYTFRKLLGKTEEGQDGTRKWTPEFVQANHRDYVTALSDCLVEGVEDPQSEAHVRLTALVLSARTLAKTIALVDPQLVSWWHAVPPQQTNLGDMEAGIVTRPGIWKKVLGVMRLTSEQRSHLLEHRSTLLSQLGEVARQRQDIISGLQATIPSANPSGGYTPPAPQNMLQQLRLNFEAEQRAYHAFLNNCFSKTLNAVQEARAQVAAFPQQPDMLAIAELIEEEETRGTAAGSNGYHPSESLPESMPLKIEGTNPPI